MPHFNNYHPETFGWTDSPHKEHIVNYSFNGVDFVGGVHKSTVGIWNLLLNELVNKYHYPLIAGECWGWSYRNIRNGTVKSFHAFGTAIDINASHNGFSPSGAIVPHTMPDIMGTIARKYYCEWGGSWRKPKDNMHIEYHGTEAEIPSLIKKYSPKSSMTSAVHYSAPYIGKVGSRSIRLGSVGNDVKYVQRWLGVKADGFFGPITEAAVKRYQRMRGIAVDGIVGRVTWHNMKVG
jgi:Putative peptidoglycan-binding domain-containing protein